MHDFIHLRPGGRYNRKLCDHRKQAGIGYEIFMTGEAIEQAARMEGKVKDPYLFPGERGCHAAVWVLA